MIFRTRSKQKSDSGIAIFMVISAMMILSVVVTEFAYVAQVNQRMAYDSLDQLKALYSAKSAFKLSLLRLKAYQNVRAYIANMSSQAGAAGAAAAQSMVPQKAIDQIWAFPFSFPLPLDLPGMTMVLKDEIKKFQDESNIAGKYTSFIESESSKFNLNTILQNYLPLPKPSSSPAGTSTTTAANNGQNVPAAPGSTPTPQPTASSVSLEVIRQDMSQLISQILANKFQADPDFQDLYRDIRVPDLMDQILLWSDVTYQSARGRSDEISPKRAPMYSITELAMIPQIDDAIYDLLSGSLTVAPTNSINVNKITGQTLKAIFPLMLDPDIKLFFEFRDSQERDNSFKSEDDFFKALAQFSPSYNGSRLEDARKDLAAKGYRFVIQENVFKIKATAQVNGATKTIEAEVLLLDAGAPAAGVPAAGTAPPPATANPTSTSNFSSLSQTGLKITFMRIL